MECKMSQLFPVVEIDDDLRLRIVSTICNHYGLEVAPLGWRQALKIILQMQYRMARETQHLNELSGADINSEIEGAM
jgi:hypothetical protein